MLKCTLVDPRFMNFWWQTGGIGSPTELDADFLETIKNELCVETVEMMKRCAFSVL